MQALNFYKAGWIQDTNVYEVNIRQYSREGTFGSFLLELPRLRNMGVEILWFMPVTPISQKNKKGSLGSPYACSDYTAINPELGTMDDFKILVQQAQSMGFKVIIDWVANHTGWDHIWTGTNPDYYLTDPATGDFKMASGMDDIIELNYQNPDLRNAMIDAMQFWVSNTGIDGFRCDLAFWVTLDFWIAARTALQKTKTLFWLGEFDPLEKPEYAQVFDAGYTWTWMHKTEDFYKGKLGIDDLLAVLMNYQQLCGDQHIPVWFTSNHDENSWNGTEFEKYGKMAPGLAVLSFTWNGMPLIYSGQELPNTKRLEFFEKDAIAWDGTCEREEFYKILTALKKNNPALHAADTGTKTLVLQELTPLNCLGYLRKGHGCRILVLLNWSDQQIRFRISSADVYGVYQNVFNREAVIIGKETYFELEPWDYTLLESKEQ